eukprot:2232671-Lingulodinium_polyedra.AAC.1
MGRGANLDPNRHDGTATSAAMHADARVHPHARAYVPMHRIATPRSGPGGHQPQQPRSGPGGHQPQQP